MRKTGSFDIQTHEREVEGSMRPTVPWCSEVMAMPMRLHRGVIGQGKPSERTASSPA